MLYGTTESEYPRLRGQANDGCSQSPFPSFGGRWATSGPGCRFRKKTMTSRTREFGAAPGNQEAARVLVVNVFGNVPVSVNGVEYEERTAILTLSAYGPKRELSSRTSARIGRGFTSRQIGGFVPARMVAPDRRGSPIWRDRLI